MTASSGFGIIWAKKSRAELGVTERNIAMGATLYGLGVGPGDPELLTLKAVKTLQACSVLVVPDADRGESVAYQIAVQACPEIAEKEVVSVRMPMTHDLAVLRSSHRAAAMRLSCK